VIHAVGPEYEGEIDDGRPEAELLECTYRNVLVLARDSNITSIALPAMSTGAFCFPVRRATKIAVSTVVEFLTSEPHCFELVRFVVYGKEQPAAYTVYCETLAGVLRPE
jgi:O-acetyl-ADP-ribose deacetylase (regulator of RNase III)